MDNILKSVPLLKEHEAEHTYGANELTGRRLSAQAEPSSPLAR